MAEAARIPQQEEVTKAAAVGRSRSSNLTVNLADSPSKLLDQMATYDVSRMVIDSPATRADLRIVMDSDDEIGQCIETRLDKLLGVDWRLQGSNQSARKFIEAQLKLHYDCLAENSFMSRWYGLDVIERIWAQDSTGYWYVKDLLPRPFEWFGVDRSKRLYYRPKDYTRFGMNVFNLRAGGVQVDTNIKFLLTLHKPTYTNPMGKAQAAYLFWPWFYRKTSWQFWMQFLERSGQPMLVGESDNPVDMANKLALAVQDAVIAITKGDKVDSISPSNKGEAFVLAEDRLVRRIQKVILGQTLTSDVGGNGTGSKALGEVHNEVRGDKTMSDLKLIRPTIQNYIDALVAMNFPGSSRIELVYAVDRGLEAARAARDALLLNTGIIELSEQYFMREYGFLPGDIKLVQKAAQNLQQPPQNKG